MATVGLMGFSDAMSNLRGSTDVYRLGPHMLDPRLPVSTASLARSFTALALVLAALFVTGVTVAWRRAGARKRTVFVVALVTALGAVVWLGGTYMLARIGLLRFDTRPPTMALMFGALAALAVGLGLSRVGARLATGLPVAVLVGVQAFRLPLELMMNGAFEAGLMPRVMSYGGLNFDIVTGITAILVASLIVMGRAGTRTVRAWNLLGTLLLLNVLIISLLSTPGALRVFRAEPPNTWITAPPYVWLPTVMVVFAIVGHIVLFRRLRFEDKASPAALPVEGRGVTMKV